mmetsp:Transcript_14997/g.34711  ORF Transcript_14997/g.34711 Transcript_14997/m.34711 type:complete len:292 (-) Transcript_14997:227-1102(-)
MRIAVIGLALLSGCSAFAATPSRLPGLGGGAKISLSHGSPLGLRASSSAKALTGLRGGVGEGKPKITYFDARGVAETARIMLLTAGVEYDDDRYKVAMVDGVPSVPQFKEDKETGKLVANMGRLPIMDVGTAKFGQSHAINRYIATHHGFMGKTAEDAAIIDCLYECLRDMKDAFAKIRGPGAAGTAEEKKAKTEEYWNDTEKGLPDWLKRFEETLASYTPEASSYAFGSSLSLIDFAIYTWIESLTTNKDLMALGTKPWESCPRINASYKSVLETPAVAKWIKERPETMF